MGERLFRHFKGEVYKYIGRAVHTESDEILVLYTRYSDGGSGRIYARPKEMFFGTVQIGETEVRRFTELTDIEKQALMSEMYAKETMKETM